MCLESSKRFSSLLFVVTVCVVTVWFSQTLRVLLSVAAASVASLHLLLSVVTVFVVVLHVLLSVVTVSVVSLHVLL